MADVKQMLLSHLELTARLNSLGEEINGLEVEDRKLEEELNRLDGVKKAKEENDKKLSVAKEEQKNVKADHDDIVSSLKSEGYTVPGPAKTTKATRL